MHLVHATRKASHIERAVYEQRLAAYNKALDAHTPLHLLWPFFADAMLAYNGLSKADRQLAKKPSVPHFRLKHDQT